MTIVFFLLCTALSFLTVYTFKNIALKRQIFDKPDEFLKTHTQPVPFLGGVGIVSAFYLMSLLFIIFNLITLNLFFIITFIILYSVIGLLDDFKNISVFLRLIAEISISIIVFALGIRISISPFIILNLFITFIFIVGLINAVNMEDGMDGLAGGLVLISSIILLILNYLLGNTSLVLLLSIFAGSILGFLFHNYPPAKIFMGDSGSYFLGGGISIFAILSINKYNFFTILGIVFVIGMPIFDLIFVFSKRILNKKSPFSGDRSHLYDLIKRKTKSTLKTLYIFYSFQIITVLIGFYLLYNFN